MQKYENVHGLFELLKSSMSKLRFILIILLIKS